MISKVNSSDMMNRRQKEMSKKVILVIKNYNNYTVDHDYESVEYCSVDHDYDSAEHYSVNYYYDLVEHWVVDHDTVEHYKNYSVDHDYDSIEH